MKRSFSKVRASCLLITCFLMVTLWGCDNPGSVEGDIGGGKAEVQIDTLKGISLSSQSLNYYSGNFRYIAAGSYSDPLFGDVSAKGLLKPKLPRSTADDLTPNANISMRLQFDKNKLYGDSATAQNFDVYEINEFWRGNAFKFQDDISLKNSGSPLVSFSLDEGEDSVNVPLPKSWINDYKEFANNDSADSYRKNSFGLALVPENSNKMLAIEPDSSQFVIQNPSADTSRVSLSRWASSLERTNKGNIPTGSTVLHSTNEKFFQFDLDLSDREQSSQNVSNGELVIYRNNDLLNSSVSGSVIRPAVPAMKLFLIDPGQLPDNITPGSPIAPGTYSTDDNAYHYDLTGVVSDKLNATSSTNKKLVVVLFNNGAVSSTVVYNNNAPASKKPKLIITSLKN